ncbi:MAG TPA: hypothetical protein VGP72_33220 [Planctomycetota bacterium]|jgi:membrane-associated HD superfamily phosphohydrolase
MLNLRELATREFTSTERDKRMARVFCGVSAAGMLAMLLIKLPLVATNQAELTVALTLAVLMSSLVATMGFFAHRLSFGTRTNASLSSEWEALFCSRKSTCKAICIGLGLLTLLLGIYGIGSATFTQAQLVIAVECVACSSLAWYVVAICIGPTAAWRD